MGSTDVRAGASLAASVEHLRIPTDLTLQAVDGVVKPAATAVPVQFSGGGSGDLAQIKSDSGQWLSESWKLGSLLTPTLDGSSATYADVLPDVDLKLTATATGMAEVLVVKNAAAAANPDLASVTFGVDDGDLTTTTTAGGSSVSTSPNGATQLVSAAATWWDSSAPGSNADGPGGLGLPIPVDATVTDTSVTIDAETLRTSPTLRRARLPACSSRTERRASGIEPLEVRAESSTQMATSLLSGTSDEPR